MQGLLFKYGPGSAHVAFATQAAAHRRHIVLVGGLTDGLLFAPYTQQLASAAHDAGWSLVQAQLSSSYTGFGTASLDQDADELRLLSMCLAAEHNSAGMVIMGHSTGCQDAVRYVQRHPQRRDAGSPTKAAPLLGVVLQAPVSDREYLSMQPHLLGLLPKVRAAVQQGQGEGVLLRAPAELGGGAICARRMLALADRLGDDDMFSSDLSSSELSRILGCLKCVPVLVLVSGSDDCVPPQLVPGLRAVAERLAAAMDAGVPGDARADPARGPSPLSAVGLASGAGAHHEVAVIPGACHNCYGNEDDVVAAVVKFLHTLPTP